MKTTALSLLLAGMAVLSAAEKAREPVVSIKPPKNPLPSEEVSAGVTQFSFIVYGDTRGRRDGKEVQYEHSLIVDSMLSTISKLRTNGIPVRFVLQSGDAVVDGRSAKQWNASFVSLINRITTDGGVPYFLAPGNHDVTAAADLASTNRMNGLSNYLSAVTQLIPPDGAPRRLDGYPVFAFGYGNSFFLALDSNIAGDLTQYAWAADQLDGLDRHRYKNIFAFFHHPIFSSGGHGGYRVEQPTKELRQMYMPLFRKHHVRAILSGHEHFFEHWVERYADESGQKQRMDLIVTGGGGAPLARYQGDPDTGPYKDMYKKEKVELEHLVRPGASPGENAYHYVVVTVDGTNIKMNVVGVDWGSDFKPYRSSGTALQ